MTLADFVRQSEDQCIDVDHAYGCQCVDLADAWATALGYPLPLVAGAKDFAGQAPTGWSWIPNDPNNNPQPGDLVVWDSRIGPYGHVALCLTGDANSFTSLDQNWVNSGPMGSPATRVTHNYFGVAGWLRPTKPGGPPLPATPFFVNTHADAQWYGAAFGADPQGPAASLTNLKIVEVVSQPDHFYYRWEGGAWWLKDVDCDAVAPPAPTPPPTTDLEARVHHLEARLAAAAAGLNT